MEKEVQKGCPQGSWCDPGFWNVMYNSLLNLKFNSQSKVMAFVDDFIVLTGGTYRIEAENYVNQDLKQIERWAADNKIEFNDKKSKVIFISRTRNDDREVNIYLNHKRLDQNEEMKYLGVYLDSKFNFNAHIDHTVAKSISLINMLARTAKLQWGFFCPFHIHGAPVD
jgi:hypothetical protein